MRKACLLLVLALLFSLPAFAQTAGVNRIKNASFETADPNNGNLASGWQVYNAPYTRVHNFNVWDQNFVVSLQAGQGAVQRVVLNQAVLRPVRITARVRGENIVDDSTDKLGASLDCKIAWQDGTYSWCPTTMKTKSVGTFDWKIVGVSTASLYTNSLYTKIAWIDVRLTMGNVAGTAYFDDVHVEEYNMGTTGMVSFCFHDSFMSTYTKGYPLLNSYGYVGSVAAVTSYMGANGNHMTLAQHQDLFNHNWPILSHTVHHYDLTTLSMTALNDELYWSQKYLADNGMPTKHIALPFGAYNGTVMSRIQAEWYGNLNYVSAQLNQDWNEQGMFPYSVGVYSIKSTTTAADVASMLSIAQGLHQWVVLVIHEIDNPNNAPWNVSYDTFRQIVDTVRQSGLPVVSYDYGFDSITKSQ